MTHPTEPRDLMPCPFCGSGPAIPFGRGPGQASFSGVELMRGARGRRYVQCGTCGAQSLCSFHEGAAISNWNTRTAAEAASREEWPTALLEQSCCLGLIGKNVIIDCETRAEAEEVLDWLCGERTARAALSPADGGEHG